MTEIQGEKECFYCGTMPKSSVRFCRGCRDELMAARGAMREHPPLTAEAAKRLAKEAT
jgi:hypothetical protein